MLSINSVLKFLRKYSNITKFYDYEEYNDYIYERLLSLEDEIKT